MITTTPSTYDTQAADFLARFNLAVKIELRTPENCPPWGDNAFRTRSSCPRCGSTHGREYLVTLSRENDKRYRLSFAYWGAHADRPGLIAQGRPHTLWEEEQAKRNNKGKHPSAYDVLSCLSSDASCPTTADEVVEEFGDMKPSQAEGVAAHARKVRDWFTPAELSALQEIS